MNEKKGKYKRPPPQIGMGKKEENRKWSPRSWDSSSAAPTSLSTHSRAHSRTHMHTPSVPSPSMAARRLSLHDTAPPTPCISHSTHHPNVLVDSSTSHYSIGLHKCRSVFRADLNQKQRVYWLRPSTLINSDRFRKVLVPEK